MKNEKEIENYNPFLAEDTEEKNEEDIWLEKRRGYFTGSRNSDLMSCNKEASRLSWDDPKKIVGFGTKAIPYIFSRMMERRTGLMSMKSSSKQMDHGKEYEPLFIDRLIEDGVISNYEECDFINSLDIQYLGATPDGSCIVDSDFAGLEIKCPVSWEGTGFFNRVATPMSEKHQDFWQLTTEAHVLGVNKVVFAVAMPMQVDEYDIVNFELSEVHEKALIARVKIANRAIEICKNYDIQTALKKAIIEYDTLGEEF